MSKNLIETLQQELLQDINDLGYELVDIEFMKESGENYLRFYIHKDGGVNINDCELVSKFLDTRLDDLDPIQQQYYLEVSSPDLNRPLKTDDDLKRNMGVTLDIHLYKKINGIKDYRGDLVSYNQESIKILVDDEEITLERKDISLIKVAIIF